MIKEVIPGQGLVIEQKPLTRPDRPGKVNEIKGRHVEAVAEAEAWLVEQGMDPWAIAELDLPRRVRHVWWSDEAGFVPAGWTGGPVKPLLIVHVPVADPPPVLDPPKEVRRP